MVTGRTSSSGKLKKVRLNAPVQVEDLRELEVGNVVYLDGILYTGREGLYNKLLVEKAKPPVPLQSISNVNFHCSPAATVHEDGSYEMGAVTATASFRFSKYLAEWFQMSDCKMIIGKGGMSEEDYRNHFVPNNAVYLTTVGYGTGALLGRGIKSVDAHWLDELGIAQAMWVLTVQNFGPFLVDGDLQGNSLFEQQNQIVNQNIQEAYKGLKPPALKRYGETTSRNDEVV
jgi:L(+)-tartrate dehydratase beta subunit|tara:strand:+ start:327 stop:1016 length:690 start_codon:yes stop_codon:yes gene_type:complete